MPRGMKFSKRNYGQTRRCGQKLETLNGALSFKKNYNLQLRNKHLRAALLVIQDKQQVIWG